MPGGIQWIAPVPDCAREALDPGVEAGYDAEIVLHGEGGRIVGFGEVVGLVEADHRPPPAGE